MKSLRVDKEIPKSSKFLQFSPLLDEEGLIRAKGRRGKSHLDFKAKHSILLHWEHHAVDMFLQNEHENNQHEGTEHVRNIVQQKIWIMDPRYTKRLTIDQEENCNLSKGQSTNDNSSIGRSA